MNYKPTATSIPSIVSRRALLTGTLAGGAATLVASNGLRARRAKAARVEGLRHLVFVWQFSIDAAPNFIGAVLKQHDLGLVLKTHDGVEWMAEYDKSPFAVSGPTQIATLAHYYEEAGVPFHAWAVIKGIDPRREAQMAAEVLNSGVRSLFLDLEPFSGFWQATPADAVTFGRELRRLAPNGHVVLSIDARPWVVERLPMKEFVAFSNEIAPQQYWRSFDTQANYDRFAQSGFPVPPGGVTPEFLNEVSARVLGGYGLPISPTGQGATNDPGEWRRFIEHAYGLGARIVSSWRYGVTNKDVFSLLRQTPPRQPPPPAAAVAPTGAGYTVQAGDTLGGIAAKFGVPADTILRANNLDNPDFLRAGQTLVIPGVAETAAAASSDTPATGGGGGSRTYTVRSGDTLSGIANRFGTSVEAIKNANGITNADSIREGQELVI